jgi:hypothetical protein
VGELPETENESCEDIDPPRRKMPAKVEFGRRSGGFLPLWAASLFRG